MSDEITFGKAPVPEQAVGRALAPNPFDGHFPTPRDKDGKPAEALTVTLKGTPDANKAQVTNLTGKARRAADRITDADGKPAPQTARVNVTEIKDGKGKVTGTLVTFWTVDKIVRGQGSDSDAASEESAQAS